MDAYTRAVIAVDISVFAVSLAALRMASVDWINAFTLACLIVSAVNIGLSIANLARTK